MFFNARILNDYISGFRPLRIFVILFRSCNPVATTFPFYKLKTLQLSRPNVIFISLENCSTRLISFVVVQRMPYTI